MLKKLMTILVGLGLLASCDCYQHIDGSAADKDSTGAIKIVKRIFDGYVQNKESTDSWENKNLMTKSLESLKKMTDPNALEILINVWMYYDPTDFSVRPLVFNILKDSKPESTKAVEMRIKNKKEWETDDTAPYSELNDLLMQLDK